MSPNISNIETLKRLISGMANKLSSEGYDVQADYIGHPNGKPDEFNKYTPNIYAVKGDKKIIVDASDCDSLASVSEENELNLRWNAFSKVEGVEFMVIVPRSCLQKAKELSEKWGININTCWSMDI